MCVCVCVCDAHSNLGGLVQDTDPFHQVLLVVGLQIKLPHPGVNDCNENWKRCQRRPAGKEISKIKRLQRER